MDTIVSADTALTAKSFVPTTIAEANGVFPTQPAEPISDVATNLGIWLSGLQSFLQIRNYSFGENNKAKASTRDWTQEFQLTNSALLRCSKYNLQILKFLEAERKAENQPPRFDFTFEEISALAEILKHSILLNESLLRATPLKFTEWIAWTSSLNDKLKQVSATDKVIFYAERAGEQFLPQELKRILQNNPIPFAMEADLRIILPRIAKVLRWLNVIEQMLVNDEPLKPVLLLFARIYEQTREMISYINNRLLRFSDEESPIFAALDSTIYAASIETRKVFGFELGGLTEIRQAPQVFAKIETSYALINDSFQQTLVNFAQLIEPNLEPNKVFPNFQTKLEQSLALRKNLWSIQLEVQKVEQDPEGSSTEELYEKLNQFLKVNLRYLFYKDCETVERFAEEVLRITNKNDLSPILHRFGAYLETLLGQVNMRTVLANHPFDYPKD